MPMLKVGDKAPDFTARTHRGDEVSLKDYRGKTVVLWFYPKADTPGCTAEGCGFRDLYSDFDARDVQVLGASFDTVEENRRFAEKYGYQFPLLCDTDRRVGMAYGACDTPEAPYARRISYVISPRGEISRAYLEVSAASHPAEVLTTV